MGIEWQTIQAIAATQAIDMWLLFPLGIAVNRLLRRDGNIDQNLSERLDLLFGTHDWFDAFYETDMEPTLFGAQSVTRKVANLRLIGEFFVERLGRLFAQVASNPLPLLNSHNNPLYLLCFAVGNPRGASIAVRIAEHILGR